MADLPCDADGMCMVCKVAPPNDEMLLCDSCTSPWHMSCLNPPLTSAPLGDWECPDCSMPAAPPASTSHVASVSVAASGSENDMMGKIRAIQADQSLTEEERARRRQELMANQSTSAAANGKDEKANTQTSKPVSKGRRNETLEMLDQNLNCIFCMNLAERPVTTPCGHNFCLKCFQRWIGQGKKTCGKCRAAIPAAMASQPRINSALVMAIRLAKAAATSSGGSGPAKAYHHIENEKRPDKCFTSERAVKTGKANACSGRIFVTIPPDHFGPILAENDPVRGQGVLVGESWEDRMECRQWGAHFPHVAGIAGQSDYGAQSVALSGGYEDDEDHGEWFLYTGSGGRDLSGNKRTNKEQSFDQKFDKSNEALRVSCRRGYPVRVVRSHKEKRSAYAPEKGVRYDGVYRIEMCWRKKGVQGHKVCRYLFVRCDNEAAPWTSDEIGDRKRPLPTIEELKDATDVFERKTLPSWDWREDGETWGWTKDPPESRKTEGGGRNGEKSSKRKQLSIQQKLLKEFGCSLCRKVMQLPLSTPCGHNFCQSCLVAVYAGQQDMRKRIGVGGRSLRIQKLVKRCPICKGDISDFMSCPKVNRELENLIQTLKSAADGDEEGKPDASIDVKDSEKDEAREQIVKDSDDESDSPGSPGNIPSILTPDKGHKNCLASQKLVDLSVNGHSNGLPSEKLVSAVVNGDSNGPASEGLGTPVVNGQTNARASEKLVCHVNGHSTGLASEKLDTPSGKGHSNRLTSEKIASPGVNGRGLSMQDAKDSFTEDVIEIDVPTATKVAKKIPKKRGRKVVKDSEDESSDADSEFEASPAKRERVNGKIRKVVRSDNESNVAVGTPSRRLTRSKQAEAVSSFKNTRKASGGSLEDVIVL